MKMGIYGLIGENPGHGTRLFHTITFYNMKGSLGRVGGKASTKNHTVSG